jgi:hypothetical protein
MSPHRAALFVLFTTFLTAGCFRWEPVPVSPREYDASPTPEVVRVVKHDGSHVVISAPRFDPDSIRVISGACQAVGDRRNRRYTCPTTAVVALDDVEALEVKQFRGWTAFVVLVPLVAVLAWAAAFESWSY